MNYRRLIHVSWLLLLAVLLAGVIVVPARAAGADGSAARHTTQQRAGSATPVNATIYLTTPMLESLFQQNISRQVPNAFNNAISNVISKLPARDRSWAQQMIATLIQPSAALTSLTTQQNGLATSLRIALYPGDPKPIDASMLITFQVLDSSTVQVSAQSLNGGPSLANGPLATFQVPIGQLHNIITTPSCGSSALAVHLQIPIALATSQAQTGQYAAMSAQGSRNAPNDIPASANSYVEIPASSLAQIGGSIGAMPISGSLSAQNIQVGVQGSDLAITSDIYDSFFGKVGTAVTTMTPTASNGSLAVTVTNTTFTILGFISFPENSYNQQIQQTLNSKLNGAFAGKFYVTQAQIGPNGSVPCAASGSLVLSGSASLG